MTILKWFGAIASCICALLVGACAFLAMIAPYVLRLLILALIVFGLWRLIVVFLL